MLQKKTTKNFSIKKLRTSSTKGLLKLYTEESENAYQSKKKDQNQCLFLTCVF